MKHGSFAVAIFPFLKTGEPVGIGGYRFRCTTDLEGLPDEQLAAMSELISMLYLRDDVQIARATYAILEPLGVMRPGAVVERLERIRTVIGYLYSSPHPTFGDAFLPFDIVSLAILEPAKVSIYYMRPEDGTVFVTKPSDPKPDEMGFIPGYEGVFNYRSPLWLAAGSRLYGPKPNMFLNLSQNLAGQLGNEAAIRGTQTNLLFALLDAPASLIGDRVFTALNWYNDANESDGDPRKSLLSLAIAFETLLQLPRQEKTDRIADAISLLLGRTERLSDWTKQFYEARSQIVHEGRVRNWHFYTQGAVKGDIAPVFGSVMTFGRQIFQLCLKTVLTGADLAERAGLKERFIANSERYEMIAATLVDNRLAPADQLAAIFPLVDALKQYHFVGGRLNIEVVLKTIKAAAMTLLRCDAEFGSILKAALENAANSTPKNLFDSLEALSNLNEVLKHRNNRIPTSVAAFASLVDVAWLSLALTYFDMQERRRRGTNVDATP